MTNGLRMRERWALMFQVTGSNVESVAEDEIMRMLILVRNFLPGYLQASLMLPCQTHCLTAIPTQISSMH